MIRARPFDNAFFFLCRETVCRAQDNGGMLQNRTLAQTFTHHWTADAARQTNVEQCQFRQFALKFTPVYLIDPGNRFLAIDEGNAFRSEERRVGKDDTPP